MRHIPARVEINTDLAEIKADLSATSLSTTEIKVLFKEGLKEWLTEQKAETEAKVGRWAMKLTLISTIFALGYFMLIMNGWKKFN